MIEVIYKEEKQEAKNGENLFNIKRGTIYGIFQNLLGRTVIVDNMQNAIKLSKPLKKNKLKVKVKRLSKDNGCDLKYSLVEEPECYYLLVMNAPRKHVMLQHPDEYDNHLNAKPAVIEYQISVKGTNILK